MVIYKGFGSSCIARENDVVTGMGVFAGLSDFLHVVVVCLLRFVDRRCYCAYITQLHSYCVPNQPIKSHSDQQQLPKNIK